MNAIPPSAPIPHVADSVYRCPVSGTPATGVDARERWVRCPLVNNRVIFIGSCLDLQAVARSKDFWNHVYVGMFEKLAAQSGTATAELRRVCLTHQVEVLQEMLTDPSEETQLVQELLNQVTKLSREE